MTIAFPTGKPGQPTLSLKPGDRAVIVGANGSGKTRLGAWLELTHQDQTVVHRIGAQKALSLPEHAPARNVDQAEKNLLFGRSDEHANNSQKMQSRWGGHPATNLLSDYEKVLALLFAKEAQRDRIHSDATRASKNYIPVPDSPIDSIVKVWSDLMPHRSLAFHDGRVIVGKGTKTEYHAKEMSDGERVTLYLLAQCLCAPRGAVLIIDEPELHLHKSLMDKLWNKVEELCTQETLIYITHDLDFAASRAGAKKIWVQSYAPNVWTWREIPSDEQLPEALVLEIIGNRKQLLFCEGERGGLDQTVYQLCFPQFHVIPRGGAEKVIESVKALRSNAELHAFAAQGIVDRDVRGNEEIAALASQGVYTLDFAEVENLLCTREVVKLVAARLSLNIEDTVEKVQTFVSNALADELEAQVVIRAERRIRYLLSKYTKASSDEAGLAEGVRDLVSGLDIPAIVAESRAIFAKAMASGQLDGVLRIFNRKTIADRVSTCFGLKAGEYPELVVRSLKMPDRKNLVEALLMGLPKLTGAHKAVEAVDPAAGALVQHRETG